MTNNGRYSMYTKKEQKVIDHALEIIFSKLEREPISLTSSRDTADYLQIKYGNLEHEVFILVLLDNQHQLIAIEELFRGTIDGAAVYPREVVKTALKHNAAAVIFSHNHPSGTMEPSQADIRITNKLRTALQTVEIRTLDHIIISAKGVTSLAERGLL